MIKRFDTEIAAINHSGKYIIKIYHEDKVYYNSWYILDTSAREEINTKFGSTDGPKVINAAQQYIKRLGKEKGSNLLRFINEDPMMVCSLGLQPDLTVLPAMPIRFVISDGNAYIDTGIKVANSSLLSYDILFAANPSNDVKWIFGAIDQTTQFNQISINVNLTPLVRNTYRNGDTTAICDIENPVIQKPYKITNVDDSGITYEGTRIQRPSIGSFSLSNVSLAILATKRNSIISYGTGKVSFCDIRYDGSEWFFCSWKKNGVVGLLDALTGTFYSKQGSGTLTMEYGYWYNGSWVTWTPSTP